MINGASAIDTPTFCARSTKNASLNRASVKTAPMLVLGLWESIAGVFIGAGLWGLHMGLTQGLLSALVADAAPAQLRGTAFGLFNLVGGIALLAASLVAGALWQAIGPQATFLAGAGFTALALAGLGLYWRN